MSKSRSSKKSVYILTEGNTEEAYFARIGEILGNDEEWLYSVTVKVREIVSGSKTDPLHMLKEAKKSKSDYDIIWVVFDKDRDRDDSIKAAFEIAKKAKINIAFSSISFEHWIILHFEKNKFAFQRSDCESRGAVCGCNGSICAATYLKLNFYSEFFKGKSKLYDDIQSKSLIAIENAAWLRHQQSPYSNHEQLNPFSDVDILLADLMNLKNVEYKSINQSFNFYSTSIIVDSFLINGQSIEVKLNITNSSETSFPMNNNQNISLIDGQNEFAYVVDKALIIEPNNTSEVILKFSVNEDTQSIQIRFSDVHKYILIDLV